MAFQSQKDVVRRFLAALDAAAPEGMAEVMGRFCAPGLIWRGFHPFDLITGPEAVARAFWTPLKSAMTRLHHRLDLFFAGANVIDGGASVWVGTMGHLTGLFDAPWLGIRPHRKLAMLRFAAFHRVQDGLIQETALFFDIPHLMAQAGQDPFPPQTAAFMVQPGPATHDGLLFRDADPAEGARTLAALERMLGDIGQWKGGSIDGLVDELRRTWDEDMFWWGPHGIGATFTVPRYAQQHSGPFRLAFRNRQFNGHLCKIAEGPFAGFFGWPNLTLDHAGGFMGLPGGGKGDLRVIDMYRAADGRLVENWIFIDLLHWLHQQGSDVLGRHATL